MGLVKLRGRMTWTLCGSFLLVASFKQYAWNKWVSVIVSGYSRLTVSHLELKGSRNSWKNLCTRHSFLEEFRCLPAPSGIQGGPGDQVEVMWLVIFNNVGFNSFKNVEYDTDFPFFMRSQRHFFLPISCVFPEMLRISLHVANYPSCSTVDEHTLLRIAVTCSSPRSKYSIRKLFLSLTYMDIAFESMGWFLVLFFSKEFCRNAKKQNFTTGI